MKNEKNVGKTDKIIRYILGISILSTGYYFSSWFGLIGIIIMIPAILGSDPFYHIVNLNTNK